MRARAACVYQCVVEVVEVYMRRVAAAEMRADGLWVGWAHKRRRPRRALRGPGRPCRSAGPLPRGARRRPGAPSPDAASRGRVKVYRLLLRLLLYYTTRSNGEPPYSFVHDNILRS